MSTVEKNIAPLVAGDRLTWEEFERRWDAMPELKFAELIGGRVYMPPPLSEPHGEMDVSMSSWVWIYAARTPGVRAASNATCRMLGDAPQPDVHLRILEEFGGRARVQGKYLVGAPELAVEVCVSSAAYDLHEKKDLYRAAGVEEYVVVLLHENEVRWYRLEAGDYKLLPTGFDGVFRSVVFPGLWFNVPALLNREASRVIETLEAGLASPEHACFVEKLNRRRS